jgi:predicted transcriptional regulator
VLQFFAGGGFGGLWLASIGWFLLTAAQASYADVSIGDALRGVIVRDVMSEEYVTVEPGVKLQRLVDDVLLRTGRRCIVIRSDHDGRVVGLITPREIRAVDRAQWKEITVNDVMRPLTALLTVKPTTPVAEALRIMAREDVNQYSSCVALTVPPTAEAA